MGAPTAQANKQIRVMYNIDDIEHVTGARRRGNVKAKINWLLIDSRSLCFPEETLFFALKTEKNDGHRDFTGAE